MQLKIIGNKGKYPSNDAGTACYLISEKQTNIICDFGCGNINNLFKSVSIGKISAIFLSHLHFDHISDILCFKYMAEENLAKGIIAPINVFLPATPNAEFELIKNCKAFNCHTICDNFDVNIEGIEVKCFKMEHPVETYGLKFAYDGAILAYTADTILTDNLRNLMQNTSVVLGDACILQKDFKPHLPHLTVKQLADCCAQFAPNATLLLTHLPMEESNILLEAKQSFVNCKLTEKNKIYDI